MKKIENSKDISKMKLFDWT